MLGVRRVQLALLRIVAAVLVHQVAHNGSTARQKGTLNLAWSMYIVVSSSPPPRILELWAVRSNPARVSGVRFLGKS
jgi:hypothetical protein